MPLLSGANLYLVRFGETPVPHPGDTLMRLCLAHFTHTVLDSLQLERFKCRATKMMKALEVLTMKDD